MLGNIFWHTQLISFLYIVKRRDFLTSTEDEMKASRKCGDLRSLVKKEGEPHVGWAFKSMPLKKEEISISCLISLLFSGFFTASIFIQDLSVFHMKRAYHNGTAVVVMLL